MNIVILSGGSGNDSLILGIKEIYPDSNVKVIVNAYDSGKSTGLCRKITDTLGVSDVRKNHIRMYMATTKNCNQSYVEFYNNRYDLPERHELEQVIRYLKQWDLEMLVPFAERFFQRPKSHRVSFHDFNIANIIYAEMFAEQGYEETNKFFTNLLGIDDFVILNSFDNVYLQAITEHGYLIKDEGDIVSHCNSNDKICKIQFHARYFPMGLNEKALSAINDADLIVISTGTFWSSIYPTLYYNKLYEYINMSHARKIWAINNNEDCDAYGVSSNEFIQHLASLGLDLEPFTILVNSDASPLLRQSNDSYNIVEYAMGNIDGKHSSNLFARALFRIYYNLKPASSYEKILFDFDDTLWSRQASSNEEELEYSRFNINCVNSLNSSVSIISGNSYDSIVKKLTTLFGSKLEDFDVDIWADANSCLFRYKQCVDYIKDLLINESTAQLEDALKPYGLKFSKNDENLVTCLKIKPLTKREQQLLASYLNDYLLKQCGLDTCKAIITGKTTVDIVNKHNSKLAVLEHICSNPENVLYIGDEVDCGNDRDIADLCGTSIHTRSVRETSALLKLLQEDVE